jgi:hypothetical protein
MESIAVVFDELLHVFAGMQKNGWSARMGKWIFESAAMRTESEKQVV